MAAKVPEKKAIAAAIGGILTVDAEQLGAGDRAEFTTEEMASRVSEPVPDVAEVLERMAESEAMPLSQEGDTWTVAR